MSEPKKTWTKIYGRIEEDKRDEPDTWNINGEWQQEKEALLKTQNKSQQ